MKAITVPQPNVQLSCNNCFNTKGVVRAGRSFMEYIGVWCPVCRTHSITRLPMPPEYWGEAS